ncbi:MAG: hypothetical protein V2I97_00915 [Desulfococcaceae bacterium]|nr:hypothetical protein [Desulfococcaceae bacterium]
MNRITLNADGKITGEQPVNSNPLKYLNQQVELAADFSLRSYFRMLDHYQYIGEINEFFPVIREQYRECPAQGCIWEDIAYLEFAKTVELIGFPSEPRLEIYHVLRGIKDEKEHKIKSLLLENLLDIPLRLGKLKHIVFGDKVDIFEFETVFTLFELIDGIAWELSFQDGSNFCGIRR